MKIHIYLLTVFTIVLLSCNTTKHLPATIINSGKVFYDISVDSDVPSVKSQFGTKAEVEFTPELLKFVKNEGSTGFEYQLIDFNGNKTWNYLNFMDNKFRILMTDEMGPEMGAPIFHEEYQTIAGFKCQKVSARFGDGEMVAYVTKAIGVDYCPHLNIDGFAMHYMLPLPFGDVTYNATQFEKSNPTLSIDNNYATYSSIQEFQASLMANMDHLVGQQLMDLNMEDINGNTFNTDNLKDKVTVINCWFTACVPCITEIPDLNALKEKYKNADVQFLAITFDDDDKVLPFLKKHPFNYRIFTQQKELLNQLEIQLFPTTFIADKSGNIIHSESGGSFSLMEDLSTAIDTALKN